MFALKKIFLSRLVTIETGDMMCFLPGWFNPDLQLSMNLKPFARAYYSSAIKCNPSKLVKLSTQIYDTQKPAVDIPIIILHGLLGSKNNWNSMAKAIQLKTNRKVVTVDARNHGDSPHSDEFSYELMVCDLLKVMSDLNITKASFIGHSMGGRASMLLALSYPKFVHSLVVVDISPIGVSPNMMELPKLFKLIQSLVLHPYLTLREARKRAGAQLREKIEDENLVNFILTNLVENEKPAYEKLTNWRWKFNLDSISKNFLPEICRFPVVRPTCSERTLFVAGGRSDYIMPKDEEGIRSIFSNSKFAYIQGAGHWVHAEKPQEFLMVVCDFLSKDYQEM